MTHAHTLCAAALGVDGYTVQVEADLADGVPSFTLVGFSDANSAETRDRVRAAVVNSGYAWPERRITVGLFPTTLPKSGSGFDLAVAATVLGAAGVVPLGALGARMLVGELTLDGQLRPVRGVLPAVTAAVAAGVARVVVPPANTAEAAVVPGVVVEAVPDLRGLVGLLRGELEPAPDEPAGTPPARAPRADPAERLARAALSRAVGPDDPRVGAQVRELGAVEIWDRLRRCHPGIDPERDLDLLARAGGRLLCPGDDEWPHALGALDRPSDDDRADEPGTPLALWVRGTANLAAVLRRAVAVVGSRASTTYGNHLAREVGFTLAGRDWAVVSGAAFGIDAAAHRGALLANGPTFAVLASGIDVPYPRAHADLLDEIARHGAVVSEAPPGTPPFRRRFLARNRLVAALTQATVLVEAGPRSGTLSTARHAHRLGRPVMAYPGPVTSATSAGCHQLLRDGAAVLVTDARHVLDHVADIAAKERT